MIYTIFIPTWHPTTINQLLRSRWKAARLKKADRDMIWAYSRKIPYAAGKRRFTMTIILKPGARAADPDAYHKSILDACVHAYILRDDNRQHVELMPVQFERSAAWGTRLAVEDI